MKNYTDDEIVNKVREIWEEDNQDYEKLKIEVVGRNSESNEEVEIGISKMYDAPGLTFARLRALADWFETDNISDEQYSRGGCESCDYGSKYGFILTIKENENVRTS